jgi:hypothetical protein
MAEPTQFTFDLKEVAIALIKQQGIHDGLWTVGFEFNMAAGIIGAVNMPAMPATLIQLMKVQLVKQDQRPAPNPHITVDASEVNPAV